MRKIGVNGFMVSKMKERSYNYRFIHTKTGAILKFDGKLSIQDATILLSTMVNFVGDWDMKRFRSK